MKKQTSEGRKAENGRDWDERFVCKSEVYGQLITTDIRLMISSTANRSSRLSLRLYCKHNTT